jgi:hypothetical protein
MSDYLSKAQLYSHHAQDLRGLAEKDQNPIVRLQLRALADTYDQLHRQFLQSYADEKQVSAAQPPTAA